MAKKIPESVKHLLTQKRKFESNGKIVEREFKPVLQNVGEEEVLFIHELISQKYGSSFTIDLIKHIPEENYIYFRGTFNMPEKYQGKGTIYLDSETYEIIFDNLERMLQKEAAKKMSELI